MNLNFSATTSLVNRALIALALAIALGASLAGRAEALPGALNIAVYESLCDGDTNTDFVIRLKAEPGVNSVNSISAGRVDDGGSGLTPAIGNLTGTDAIIAMNDCPWADSTALGNTLADFQDQGGVVIAPSFNFWLESSAAGYAIQGRWASGGYSPFVQNTTGIGQPASLLQDGSNHPFFRGVPNITNDYSFNIQVAPGAIQVATWLGGQPAVAVKGQALGYNGWLGDDSGNLPTDAKWVVNAINALAPRKVTVQLAGNGKGVINNGSCTATACTVTGIPGRTVELRAVELKDSVFAGWDEACLPMSAPICQILVGYPGSSIGTWNQVPVTATFSSTKFKLGTLKGKKFSITLPGAGKLVIKGKGVRTLTKKTKKAGKLKLNLKATGSAKKKLADGKPAKVKLKFTYTPTGAKIGATVKKTLKLKP